MKITQQFFEEFLDGSDDILELGMRVLKLEILFRVHKGTIPLGTLLRSFTSNDIEDKQCRVIIKEKSGEASHG